MNHQMPQKGHGFDEFSRGSSFSKSKKSASKQKASTARSKTHPDLDGALSLETIETIRTIKDEIAFLERDLSYTFKNYMRIVPFYKLPKPPKDVEMVSSKSTRPPTPIEPISKPKLETKKTNKYIQNYIDKYEAPVMNTQKPKIDLPPSYPERDYASTIPKPSKPPEDRNPGKPKKTSYDLYKKAPVVANDSMSFDGQDRVKDQYQTLTLDQEGFNLDSNIHSLRNSNVSRASNGSKRRESFENFRRQYFQDTTVKPNFVPQQSVVKKFTR